MMMLRPAVDHSKDHSEAGAEVPNEVGSQEEDLEHDLNPYGLDHYQLQPHSAHQTMAMQTSHVKDSLAQRTRHLNIGAL